MLRRFNYTNRKKIPRTDVEIRVRTVSGSASSFDASIDVSGLKLPGDARVYVEAYHRASYMRFPWGQVSDLRVPTDRRLTDIDGGATALFRVKVIDEKGEHGQVLAEIDGISPLDGDQIAADRRSILPVVILDLGQQIWRVQFQTADDRPVLELNKAVDNIAQIALVDDYFSSLVYPAVVRQILTQILIANKRYDLNGPTDDWQTQWLQFACALPGVLHPPRPTSDAESEFDDRLMDWVDGVVESFCAHQKLLPRFIRVHSSEADV